MPSPQDTEQVGNRRPQGMEQNIGAHDPIIPASPDVTLSPLVCNDPVIPASSESTAAPPPAPASPTTEEVDVWWGAFSGWTMLPSWIVTGTASCLIWWAAFVYVEDELIQSLCLVFAGGILCLQGFRWAYRLFGFNYRLTTQRLFLSKGFLYGRGTEMALATVAKVTPYSSAIESILGVGRVSVESEEKTQPPILLEGLRKPKVIAELIQSYAKPAEGSRSASRGD